MRRPGSRATRLALIALCGLFAPASAQEHASAPPTERLIDPANCEWEWRSAGGVGVWAQRCRLTTGLWALRDDPAGFSLTVDGVEAVSVLEVFGVPTSAGVHALLPQLQKRGLIPDDGDCVFAPAEERPAQGSLRFYEIRPTGARLATLKATPPDLVPDPPCGEYGWSTHGVRYFMTDEAKPGRALYVNIGQDGMMFDESTARLE